MGRGTLLIYTFGSLLLGNIRFVTGFTDVVNVLSMYSFTVYPMRTTAIRMSDDCIKMKKAGPNELNEAI